jgi:soluble lytic murein transglycosylase-like protein
MRKIIIVGSSLIMAAYFFTRLRPWTPPPAADKYMDVINDATKKNNLPPNLLARLLQQESSFRADAYNTKSGASGIAQIVPRWHPNVDPFNPTEAIYYAAGYLRSLYNSLGYWDLALAAYNWGIGNVKRAMADGSLVLNDLPIETKNYVINITKDAGMA